MAIQNTWVQNTDGTYPWTFSTNPNSVRLVYPTGATITDIMDTVEYVITGAMNPGVGGWTRVDSTFNGTCMSPTGQDAGIFATSWTVTSGSSLLPIGTSYNNQSYLLGSDAMLYWSFTTATNWMTIYSDAARTQPVAQGGFGPGWNNQTSITITAMNSSGISGQFILAAPNASTGTVQAAARVYKAPNADGVTYKYMVLNYSNAGYLIIHVVENYNTTSKLWVNEAYQSGVNAANYGILTLTPFAFAPRIDITNGGAILLCVNPRYFVVHTQTIAGLGASTGNSWTGCVEVSRDNVEDANNPTLFPPYGWIQGTLAICSQPYGTGLGNLNPAYACCFSFPRDRFNQTGSTATNSSFLDFGFATAGNLGGINIAAGNLYSMAGSNLVNWGTNIWSGKAIGFPITVGSWTSSGVDIRGRLYGLKILTRNLGSFLDNVTLRCDPQGFLNTTNGVNTPHCVLTESGLGARYAIPK